MDNERRARLEWMIKEAGLKQKMLDMAHSALKKHPKARDMASNAATTLRQSKRKLMAKKPDLSKLKGKARDAKENAETTMRQLKRKMS